MKYYVTTSIPYVNGSPHLGHAMEDIMADVLARNARIQGFNTFFSIGTDEHGKKIAEKAEEKGISPEQFSEEISKEFLDLAKSLNISNDKFVRTTDPDHEKRAQEVWLALKDDIYKKEYVGWYCTGDEAFFTESVVKANNGICPAHNRPYEKIEEENYFFKLSKYNDQILNAIESEEYKIIPITKRNEILQLIRDGLEDISISRPKHKISWGVNVPDDDTQVMYVWFEALLNYITVLGYKDGEDFKTFWPADCHIVGKDISRFHAAIWPGILLGLKLPLPKKLYIHGFINVENQKMSKSLNNFIEPSKIIDIYGVDSFRYYFLRHIPSYSDGDFSWAKFHESYQNELGNELGNAVQRTVVMVKNYLDGDVDNFIEDKEIIAKVNLSLDACRFDRALDLIWLQIKNLNQYIDDEKPWTLHKNGEIDKLKEVLNNQCNQIKNIARLLKPFLPETVDKIENIFTNGKVTVPVSTLFPRIDSPVIN